MSEVGSTVDFLCGAPRGVAALNPYDPGLDAIAVQQRWGIAEVTELSGNESLWGPSPEVARSLANAAGRLAYYPDPSARALRAAIADLHGVDPAGIVMGNGSHELLVQIACTLVGPGDKVAAPKHGFAVFAIAAIQSGAELLQTAAYPLDHPQALNADPQALTAAAQQARLVYLANPNNPTGGGWDTATLRAFVDAVPRQSIVVIDEAYAEYVARPDWVSAVSLLADYPNLIVTRTFSKAYGLAALRIGYALCAPTLALLLERTRLTFNLNHYAQLAAVAALTDRQHLQQVCEQIRQQRPKWQAALEGLGLRVFPSEGNFLLVDFGRPTAPIFEALASRGVLLRPVAGYGLPSCLRITIADQASLDKLLAALRDVLAGALEPAHG